MQGLSPACRLWYPLWTAWHHLTSIWWHSNPSLISKRENTPCEQPGTTRPRSDDTAILHYSPTEEIPPVNSLASPDLDLTTQQSFTNLQTRNSWGCQHWRSLHLFLLSTCGQLRSIFKLHFSPFLHKPKTSYKHNIFLTHHTHQHLCTCIHTHTHTHTHTCMWQCTEGI